MVTRGAIGPARRIVAAALLAALAGCEPPPAPRPPPPPTPATAPAPPATPVPVAARTVEPDPAAAARIAADIGYLASPELGGRGTGEEGARKAADFIARRFGELRLKPLGGGGGGKIVQTYLQAFDVRVGADVAPPSLRLLQGKRAVGAPGDAIVTAEGSETGAATGAAVLVGYGITAPALKWDDYGGGDVAGKIAVLLDGVPKGQDGLRDFGSVRYKLRTAREHKAVGAVIVTAGDLPKNPQDSSAMGIPAVVLSRAAAEKLLPAARLNDPKAWEPAKAAAPRPLPGGDLEVTTHITTRMAQTWNVVGLLPAKAGSPRAGEYVILGAHYDHLGHGGPNSRAPGSTAAHLGADDNASGAALLLECARRIAALPEGPDRSIVFVAFGAEELGTLGSRYFVEHPPAPIGSMSAVAGMVNADMVGRLREDKLLVDGVGTSAGWEPLVKAASEGLGLKLAYGSEGLGASDHASFTAARVPVAFLFTGVHDDYHKPSDTADKINAEGAARVATLAGRLVLGVSQRPERLAFVDAPADPKHASRGGFKVSLGTVPDYAYEGKGLRLTGARPDSPASRAGLQAGDVIVKVGAHDITNIHDYMFSLQELEPGREVVIEVERSGARVPVKVIPAPAK